MKVGIIGTGGIARAHLQWGWAELKDVEVVAAADIVPGKAAKIAERFDIPYAFEDYHKILEMDEIDAVDVCAYNQAHRQPTVDALETGKHVFVEKPMAVFLDDATAMVRAARRAGKILMCGIKSRYNPRWIAARKSVQSGALGDIYYVQASGGGRRGVPGGSFISKETAGGGVVVDSGVYTIDNVMWVMGHPKPISVTATINNYVSKLYPEPQPWGVMWQWAPEELEVEDFGTAWVRFENGAVFSFMDAWAQHMEGMGGIYFLGTHGGLKLSPFEIYRDEEGYMVNTTPKLPEKGAAEIFKAEMADFTKAVREGLPSPIPPEEVLLTNVVMQGIYDSAKVGHEVELEIPEM